jgi:hypothetical protein
MEGMMKTRLVLGCFMAIILIIYANLSATNVWDELKGYKPPVVLGANDTGVPNSQIRVHKVGDTHLTVTNYGFFGSEMNPSQIDPETGLPAPSCQHPGNSDLEYLFLGGLWIGAIVEEDTLVSVGVDGWQLVHEMYPAALPDGDIIKRSNRPGDPAYDPEAISEADYIAIYYDTLTDPTYVNPTPFDGRPHIPLNLKIRQESYSWSGSEFEDFIIFKYVIMNLGQDTLERTFVGFYFDSDVYNSVLNYEGFNDDISGFKIAHDPIRNEDMHIAWSTDNDGDPEGDNWAAKSVRGIFGVSLLDFPVTPMTSFNWWVSSGPNPEIYDWGPMLEANYRDFGTGGIGTPEGDCNKYYIMSNGEYDYDQIYAAIDYSADGWRPPSDPGFAAGIANGFDTRFLISFGDVDLLPDDSLIFAFVLAVGDDCHQNPGDFIDVFDAADPQPFYDALDFGDIVHDILAARNLYESISMEYVNGDANYDSEVTIADIVYLINFIFLGGEKPNPYLAGDNNCDGKVNLTDVVYLINYLFRDGNEPCDLNGDGLPDC